MLEEELNRQRSVLAPKREMDVWYHVLSQAERQPCATSVQGGGKLASNPELMDSTISKPKETGPCLCSEEAEESSPCLYVTDTMLWGWRMKSVSNGQHPGKASCAKNQRHQKSK